MIRTYDDSVTRPQPRPTQTNGCGCGVPGCSGTANDYRQEN